jgi:hypothetical protein
MNFQNKYSFGYNQQFVEMIFYSIICFLVPFFFGHPQLVVGIIVNAALVLAALRLDTAKAIPVILTPSLGVLARGLIFGPYTIYLVYMIPFIWFGNAILVYLVKKFNKKSFGLGVGAVTKTAFLFLSAYVLAHLSVLPVVFLTGMGVLQFITAAIGGIVALGIHRISAH